MKAQRLSLLEAALAGAALVTVVLIVLWYAWVRALVADVAELREDRLHRCQLVVSHVRWVAASTTNPDLVRRGFPPEHLVYLSGQLSMLTPQLVDCWEHLSTAEWQPVETKLLNAAENLKGTLADILRGGAPRAGAREDAASELTEALRFLDEDPWSRWSR